MDRLIDGWIQRKTSFPTLHIGCYVSLYRRWPNLASTTRTFTHSIATNWLCFRWRTFRIWRRRLGCNRPAFTTPLGSWATGVWTLIYYNLDTDSFKIWSSQLTLGGHYITSIHCVMQHSSTHAPGARGHYITAIHCVMRHSSTRAPGATSCRHWWASLRPRTPCSTPVMGAALRGYRNIWWYIAISN